MRSASKIYRWKGLIKHYGVFLGLCEHGLAWVIHNSFEDGRVCITTLENFAAGHDVFVEREPVPGTEAEIVQRARALCGRKYDLVDFNCETFANLVTEGRGYSRQVATALGVGIGLALLGGIVAWAADAPEYDPVVDRHRDRRGRFVRG